MNTGEECIRGTEVSKKLSGSLREKKTEDTADELITTDISVCVCVHACACVCVCDTTSGVEKVTECHSTFVNLLTDSQIVDVSVTFSHMSEEYLLFLKTPLPYNPSYPFTAILQPRVITFT